MAIRGKRLRNAQRACLIRKLRENNKCCDIKYYYTRFGLRRALKRYITNISKNIVYYIDLYSSYDYGYNSTRGNK